MARREWDREGRVPLHTLRADIRFGRATAKTTFGMIGVKCWIYRDLYSPKQRGGEVGDGESQSAGHAELLARAYPDLDDDTVNAVLEAAADFANNELAPLNRTGDLQGARYENGKRKSSSFSLKNRRCVSSVSGMTLMPS